MFQECSKYILDHSGDILGWLWDGLDMYFASKLDYIFNSKLDSFGWKIPRQHVKYMTRIFSYIDLFSRSRRNIYSLFLHGWTRKIVVNMKNMMKDYWFCIFFFFPPNKRKNMGKMYTVWEINISWTKMFYKSSLPKVDWRFTAGLELC